MAVQEYRIRFDGTTALVMHNNRCVNPLDPLKKKIAAITTKGSKRLTDADYQQLYRLEFQASIYHNDHLGPHVPSRCIRATLVNGARKNRDGKQFESGVWVHGDASVQYDGPKDMEGLLAAGSYDEDGFMWTTVCGNQRASIMRTRPRFDDWSIEFVVDVEDELVTLAMLEGALRAAEVQVGICDGRSIGFGRFKATIVNEPKAAQTNGRVRKTLVSS